MKLTNKPSNFNRRILVVVSGMSPQILTETLYGLIFSDAPFVPTEIHMISTTEGVGKAESKLLNPETGQFHAICKEYGLKDITFNKKSIHVLTDNDGSPMDDIRTIEQNEAAADFITRFIAEIADDDESSIYASIAGGRKTMGYYLGYALSLFGRPQDRLSHVLVTAGYEGNDQFYFPTKKTSIIKGHDGKPLDASKAKITLAEIPFIRLREDTPLKLINRKMGFSETIDVAQKLREPAELIVDIKNKQISANGLLITLPDILLAFYLWVIDETLSKDNLLIKPNEYEPDEEYSTRFLEVYHEVCGEMRDTDITVRALAQGMDYQFFAEKISRIASNFEKQLNKRAAEIYKVKGLGPRGKMNYSTGLNIEQIKWERLVDK